MNDKFTFSIDDVEVEATPGQTILEAADAAGIYIPRLCAFKGLTPAGACRVCTVMVNGRPQAACTFPASPNIEVTLNEPELNEMRKQIVEMLFAEGNHYCMFCDKSGNCELQAVAYRFGIAAPRYPYMFPNRAVDATHTLVYIDRNRCIMCGRCVRASAELDGKAVFQLVGRGHDTRIAVNADVLGETELAATDKAIEVCPVGAIIKKHIGYSVPVGKRLYDEKPIGSDIEAKHGEGK